MKINVGTIDRVLRIVAGLVLIALVATGTVGWWGWLGVVPLATGLFRFCPAYTLLGINTCPREAITDVALAAREWRMGPRQPAGPESDFSTRLF